MSFPAWAYYNLVNVVIHNSILCYRMRKVASGNNKWRIAFTRPGVAPGKNSSIRYNLFRNVHSVTTCSQCECQYVEGKIKVTLTIKENPKSRKIPEVFSILISIPKQSQSYSKSRSQSLLKSKSQSRWALLLKHFGSEEQKNPHLRSEIVEKTTCWCALKMHMSSF